jgi:hypothetical protein
MRNYQSYKGRSINLSEPVMIYKNLHNGMFSIRQGGLVVAHVFSVELDNVSFKVSETGRQRVIKDKVKNVHAFIIGMVRTINKVSKNSYISQITYNPYKMPHFHYKGGMFKLELDKSEIIHCDTVGGVWHTCKL